MYSTSGPISGGKRRGARLPSCAIDGNGIRVGMPSQGSVSVYADDAILGFERQYEAERYLRELKEHLREYGLELNEDKTRVIRFGRFAAFNRAERGEGKPEAFTFLGLQHICGRHSVGRFEVRRITDG